jgi:hypothetical protein
MASKDDNKHEVYSWYANILNHVIRLIIFVVLLAVALEVYHYLLSDIITGKSHFFAYIVLWLFSAYIVLPRINRWIAKLYIPDYFIGRTKTGDGLLSDPVNLAFYGSEKQLTAAMGAAGWTMAEQLSLKSSLKMIYAGALGKSYPSAPVNSAFLFGRKQSLAFEKDMDGNPRKRHHVRFWNTPEHWWLPGGYQVDWLGAATFDEHVGLSLFTGQITHKIDGNIDQERDFILHTLKAVHAASDVQIVKHFTSSYHSRNGGGDTIHTDGALPFIRLA